MPFFAGFYSKDAILYLAYERNSLVFVVLVFTAILTALYMIRAWRITFFGEARSEAAGHAHETGAVMTVPLLVLAAGSVVAGYGWAHPTAFQGVLSQVPEPEGASHWTMMAIGTGAMLVGLLTALAYYRPATTDALQAGVPVVFGGLRFAQTFFDRVYSYYVDKVQQRLALLLGWLEDVFLAGWLIRGGAGAVGIIGMGVRALHVGRLHVYVYWFLVGVALLWGFAAGRF